MTRFNDPVIDQTNYNKELFDFLKKIFPKVKPVPKEYVNKSYSKEPKIKASVIMCPVPTCNYRCVEHQEPLADIFLRHLEKVHRIAPRDEFVENLKAKISYLRNNNRIPYIDPFIHVEREHLLGD